MSEAAVAIVVISFLATMVGLLFIWFILALIKSSLR